MLLHGRVYFAVRRRYVGNSFILTKLFIASQLSRVINLIFFLTGQYNSSQF